MVKKRDFWTFFGSKHVIVGHFGSEKAIFFILSSFFQLFLAFVVIFLQNPPVELVQ